MVFRQMGMLLKKDLTKKITQEENFTSKNLDASRACHMLPSPLWSLAQEVLTIVPHFLESLRALVPDLKLINPYKDVLEFLETTYLKRNFLLLKTNSCSGKYPRR